MLHQIYADLFHTRSADYYCLLHEIERTSTSLLCLLSVTIMYIFDQTMWFISQDLMAMTIASHAIALSHSSPASTIAKLFGSSLVYATVVSYILNLPA